MCRVSSGSRVFLFFTDFETESGYDKLYISWTGCFGASRYDYDEMKQGDLGSVSVSNHRDYR